MTVTVPPRLARRPTAAPADAFLLRDPGRLAEAVAALGSAAVFRVAGGFLLVPADTTPARLPAAVPLRRLAGDLYIPADADLIPALLPDEVTALTRDTGLVVLAGGPVLGFAADHPLAPADWLHVPSLERGDWQPLPAPPPLADRLTKLERPAVPVAIEQILGKGEPGDRRPLPAPGEAGEPADDARPPSAGPLTRTAAGAGLAAAKLLALMGAMFKSAALAKAGANLARRAVERVPRLSEKVLGAQEAALRHLLKQLQGGDIESALRRAPPAFSDPDLPGRIDTSANLGDRNPWYSLASLFGGGGTASVWLGGGDVWAKLADEYRRLAREAVARGDHRRAAYLHGVLLRDFRAAAAVLLQGGLYRDAALLYRDKVKDDPAAARAFEQAGDFDEAVRLYVKCGLDEPAGDLLHRLGLFAEAAERYTAAADKHAAAGRWVAAGDLLRVKLGEPQATVYYRRGWNTDAVEAVACGERLYDQLVVAEDWPGTRTFLTQAEAILQPPRTADAGRLFNYARKAGADFLPADLRADLDDQTRLLFAAHLQGSPSAAKHLFGGWPGPVTRDALYAARQPEKATPEPPPAVPVADGIVRAVAVAHDTDAVVIATTETVELWRPGDGRRVHVCRTGGPRVVGLAVSADAERVYVLKRDGDDLLLDNYAVAGDRAEYRCQRRFPHAATAAGGWALHPPDGRRVVLDVLGLRVTLDDTLMHDPAAGPPAVGPAAVFTLPAGDGWVWDWRRGELAMLPPSPTGQGLIRTPHWTPAVPDGSPLAAPVFDWWGTGLRMLEVVGVDAAGVLHWDRWYPGSSGPQQETATDSAGYRAACLTAPGRVAAVNAANIVHWLRASGGKLVPVAEPTRLTGVASAVAVASRRPAGEVLVVFADGSTARPPCPA